MFKPGDIAWKYSVKTTQTQLQTAFAGQHKVAYALTPKKTDVYWASSESGYDPVFTLLATGHCDGATMNYGTDKMSDGANGIRALLRAISEKNTFAAGGGNAASFALPKGGLYFHYISLKAQAFVSELTNRYKVLSWSEKVVDDIRSVEPSKRTSEGVLEVSGMHTVHRIYMAAAFTILRKAHQNERDGVVALIVDKQGRIISWGRKSDDTMHGETSAIMRLGGVIPPGSVVYSTLKPCSMCAGLLTDASKGDIKVYWGQHDPGKAAGITALDRNKTGSLLNAGKLNPGARAILIGAKPKKGDRDTRPTLPNKLADSFGSWQGKKDDFSAIDYIVSKEGMTVTLAVETMLRDKFRKYKGDVGGNENTRKVIRYVIAFLQNLNLAPDNLG